MIMYSVIRHVTPNISKYVSFFSEEKGAGLAESLVAIAIVGIAIGALVGALSTGSVAVKNAGTQIPAESLAVSQMEFIKNQQYQPVPANYASIDSLPADYTVSTTASPIEGRDSDIQKITVTISYQGDDVLAIENYKVNR